MISIGENALTAKLAHLLMSDGLDGGAGRSTDKGRSFNIAMRSMNDAGAHEASLFFDVEFEGGV